MKRGLIIAFVILAIWTLAGSRKPIQTIVYATAPLVDSNQKPPPNTILCAPYNHPELWPRECLSRATTDQRIIDAWEREHGEKL